MAKYEARIIITKHTETGTVDYTAVLTTAQALFLTVAYFYLLYKLPTWVHLLIFLSAIKNMCFKN